MEPTHDLFEIAHELMACVAHAKTEEAELEAVFDGYQDGEPLLYQTSFIDTGVHLFRRQFSFSAALWFSADDGKIKNIRAGKNWDGQWSGHLEWKDLQALVKDLKDTVPADVLKPVEDRLKASRPAPRARARERKNDDKADADK